MLPLSSSGPILGCPVDTLGVNSVSSLLHSPEVAMDHLGCEAYHVLALVIVDEVEVLEGGYDILLAYACPFNNFTE